MPGEELNKHPVSGNSLRRIGKALSDLALLAAAYYGAFLLRFDGHIPEVYSRAFLASLPIILTTYFIVLVLSGAYRGIYRYASIHDLAMIGVSNTIGVVLLFLLFIYAMAYYVPRSVLLIFWLMALVGLGGIRFAHRIYTVYIPTFKKKKSRLMVVGAGDAAEMLVRQMQKGSDLEYRPVLFVDDAARKRGSRIHGLSVLGPTNRIPELVREKRIDEIVIAVPSATASQIRRIVSYCQESGVRYKTLPGLKELVNEQFIVEEIRDVRIEDLLERAPVSMDDSRVRDYFEDRVVLVTGAAGSIGSELCRQLASFKVGCLVMLDRAESDLFDLEHELKRLSPETNISCAIADILNESRLRFVFESHHPHTVFHAAAYKHVPMMEAHPEEAVLNNTFGTIRVSKIAQECGVARFVHISTDKAVNPTSVMGATKRIAELYCVAQNGHGPTKHTVVRFGNVLDSRGSVVPLFKQQIRDGGPVTVTSRDVKRYFMTIPEAVELVLQAGIMGEGGEIFILDMGEPIRVYDMARHLISLSGLEPEKDIEIRVTGLRPGEKLSEELWHEDEYPASTRYPNILQSTKTSINGHLSEYALSKLRIAAERGDAMRIRRALKEIVPTYSNGKVESQQPIAEFVH